MNSTSGAGCRVLHPHDHGFEDNPDLVEAVAERLGTLPVLARGRFVIGSGHSIPSYVPVENCLTMLDEALR